MALVDPIIGRMSGKLGGMVFLNGQGGQVVRILANPVNPGSDAQEVIRAASAQLAARWVGTLTEAQRESWRTYAANVAVQNRFGNPIHLNGLAMYVRCNVSRIQWYGAGTIVDSAPVIFNLGEFTAPSVQILGVAEVAVTFNAADDWVSEDGASLLAYSSLMKNESVLYFRGPYRKTLSGILGNSVTPPPSPTSLAPQLSHPFLQDKKTFFFFRVMRLDGRLSAPVRVSTVANYI